MAKQLKQIFSSGSDEIAQSFTIESWHVSQSVDALTGGDDYDITISGSLTITGSTFFNGIDNTIRIIEECFEDEHADDFEYSSSW